MKTIIIVLIVTFIILFLLSNYDFFKNEHLENIDHCGTENTDDNIETYIPGNYWGTRCLSPYCRRNKWWYNRYTPLPWGNSARIPRWYYPLYPHIYNYY